MAPSPWKASWRRADTTITRSDGVGAVSMSTVSVQQSGSQDGLLKSSSTLDTHVSLIKPTSSTNSQSLSATSSGVSTSSLPESSPAAISTTLPSTTNTRTFLHSLGATTSSTSLPIVQSTSSNVLSAPVSTDFNSISTTHVVTSSLPSSLLPAVTTKSPPTSIAADILDVVSSSLLDAKDAAQISTSTSSIPSSTPHGTSSTADVTSSSLLPLTTALSKNLLSPTESPTPLNQVLSTERTSIPAVASTPVDIPLFTLTPSLALHSNTISTLTPIPISSTTTASGEPIEITTTSPGIPINESSSNRETKDIVSVSPTPTDVDFPSTKITSVSVGTTLATLVPSVTGLQGDRLHPDLSQLNSSVSPLFTTSLVETGTTVSATAAIATPTPTAITPSTPISIVSTTNQSLRTNGGTTHTAPVPSVTTLQGDRLQPDLSQLGSSVSAFLTSFLEETGTTVSATAAITTPTPAAITPSVLIPAVPKTTQTTSISRGITLTTPVPSVTALQGDRLHPDLSQLGSSVSAFSASFLIETDTAVSTTAAITTPTPAAITPSVLIPAVPKTTQTTSINGGTTLTTPVPSVTAPEADALQPDLSRLGSSVSALSTSTSFLVETDTAVSATAAITTPTPAAITPSVLIPSAPTTTQTTSINGGNTPITPVPSFTAPQADGLQSQSGTSVSALLTSFLVETDTTVSATAAITTPTPAVITPTVPTTTQTTSINGGTTPTTPVPSFTAPQADGLQSQSGTSVSALSTSFLVETGTTVSATAAITTPDPAAITPSVLIPTVPTITQTPSFSVGTTLATSALSGIPLVDNGSQPDPPQLVPSGSIALTPAVSISSFVDLGTNTVTTPTAITGPIAPTAGITSVPSPNNVDAHAVLDTALPTDSSVGISSTQSLFTTTSLIVSVSTGTRSGTPFTTSITMTSTVIEETEVPVSSPAAKRSSVPIAAIAASTAAAVVLILILVGLWYRRRRHFRRASLPTFSITRTPEIQETEAMPHSRLYSLPVSPPFRSTGGWNDPPVAASAFAEHAQNPFADQVSTLDGPSNTSRFVAPPLTRAIRPVSVPDPFADPPALVSTPEGELPSRLSKASSYDMHDPRASVTSSNVGCAM